MALKIDADECVNCAACEPLCPNQAISHDENTFMIDAKACTECEGFHDSSQCVLVCPVDCIHPFVPFPPIQTAKRAKLYQQVVKSFDQPDTIFFN